MNDRPPIKRQLAFSPELAHVLHAVKSAIRAALESRGHIEVAYPHLDPGRATPYYKPFTVTAPGSGLLEGFVGSLLISGGRYMIEAARAVGRAYRIGATFRIESHERPNRLLEFQSTHFTQEAPLADAYAGVEAILQAISRAASRYAPGRRSAFERLAFPLRRLSRAEAARLLALGPAEDLTLSHQLELLHKVGVPALFLTGTPPSVQPYAAFHRIVDGEHQNFELVLEYAGEMLGGAEYETDEVTLREQLAGSLVLRRAMELGVRPEDYAAPTIELLAMRSAPMSTVYSGFERLMMYALGCDQIRDVVLYPVTREFLLDAPMPERSLDRAGITLAIPAR